MALFQRDAERIEKARVVERLRTIEKQQQDLESITIDINKNYVGDSFVKGVPKFDITLYVALEANSKYTINDIDKAIYVLPANSFKESATHLRRDSL